MSSKKNHTPSKEDLLDELKSIKAFLDDEHPSLAGEIPTLTAVAAPINVEKSIIESEQVRERNKSERDDGEGSALESQKHDEYAIHEACQQEDTFVSETDGADQAMVYISTTEGSFDDINEPDDMSAEDPAQPTAELTSALNSELAPEHPAVSSTSHGSLNANMPKARGENPFLPPHIRERLGKHKEIFEAAQEEFNLHSAQRVEIQGDLLEGFNATIKHTVEPTADSAANLASNTRAPSDISYSSAEETAIAASFKWEKEKQALIDDLVAEFLPKIEAKLRAELAAKAFKPDD